jgi:hypothetical protein
VSDEVRPRAPRAAPLVFALVAPPAAWALDLGISYALTTPVCEAGSRWILHLVGVLALALSAAGGLVALRLWRNGGSEAAGGHRFLLMAAMTWSVLLTLVLVASLIPAFAGGCD